MFRIPHSASVNGLPFTCGTFATRAFCSIVDLVSQDIRLSYVLRQSPTITAQSVSFSTYGTVAVQYLLETLLYLVPYELQIYRYTGRYQGNRMWAHRLLRYSISRFQPRLSQPAFQRGKHYVTRPSVPFQVTIENRSQNGKPSRARDKGASITSVDRHCDCYCHRWRFLVRMRNDPPP